MVDRVVVGAHYGMRDWLMQRITSVVVAAYVIGVGLCLVAQWPVNYGSWKSMFDSQWFRVASMLFIVSLLLHAWVGVRDILMDYIKPAGLRLFLMAGVVVCLLSYAIWAAAILWGGA